MDDKVNVEPTGAWNPVMELVISRINGIQYPLEDVEAMMFHDYFDVDRRDIDIRGGVLLMHDGQDYQKLNHQWCLSHRMLMPQWYPYAVLSLTLQDSDATQMIDQGHRVGSFSISKYNTKVVMQGSVSRVIPYVISQSQIAEAMSETYNGSADGGPATSFLPFAFIMSSNATRRSPDSDDFRYALVTVEDVSTASHDQQLTLSSSTSDGSNFNKGIQQLGGIHRMFQMSSSGLDPTIQIEVMKEPVLMLHDDNTSPHDIAHELQSCAIQLGVGYYSLDARLLFQYPFKATRSDQSSAVLLHPLSYNNRPAGKALSLFTAELLARAAPFLLHVENVDMVLLDPASQASSVQINGEEEIQDKWCRIFKGFVSDLYGHLHRRRRTEAHSTSYSCRIPFDCVITTVVTASQTNAHQFKGALKSMFSSEIILSTATSSSILDRSQIERVVGAILNRKGVSSVSCDAEIISAMSSYLSSSGWSYSSYRLLAQDTLWNAFVRSYCCNGFFDGNDDDNDELLSLESVIACIGIDVASDDDGYVDSTEIEIDVTDVAASLDRIPCLREGFYTSVFEANSGHKSFHEPSNISPVYWQDIGGLEVVRKEILDVLELPYKHSDLFRSGYPRRQGILLYGPPGTGKTLVAKAVATECNIGFVSVKGPELLDSYIGESERNIRDLFEHAKQIAPCVLFFDEIDSIAPARAKNNDSSGGVMDRIVSQLLTEIDMIAVPTNTRVLPSDSSVTTGSIVTDKLVFVIAATNRPDLLDSALLRPGRFDRKIYLGVCEDVESRHQILRAQTRKFDLSTDVDLLAVARMLPRHVTGADISGVTGSAFSGALERKITELTREALLVDDSYNDDHNSEEYVIKSYINSLNDDCITVQITSEDFDKAVLEMKPSLVDLSYYDALHRMYSDNLSS